MLFSVMGLGGCRHQDKSRETRDRLSRAMVQTSRNLSDYIELALTDRFQKDGIHWRTLTITKGSSSWLTPRRQPHGFAPGDDAPAQSSDWGDRVQSDR